ETASERDFHVVNCLEDGFVGAVEQWCDLVDAEESVSVENESDEELAGSEFRVVEGCAASVGRFPVTTATPDAGRTIESVESVGVTVRAGTAGPDGFESPLDDGVERLWPKLYYSEINELLKHSAESSAFVGHKRLLSAECPNFDGLVPLRYTRAGLIEVTEVVRGVNQVDDAVSTECAVLEPPFGDRRVARPPEVLG